MIEFDPKIMWKNIENDPDEFIKNLKSPNNKTLIQVITTLNKEPEWIAKNKSLMAQVFRLLNAEDLRDNPELIKISNSFYQSGIFEIVQNQEAKETDSTYTHDIHIKRIGDTSVDYVIDSRILMTLSPRLRDASSWEMKTWLNQKLIEVDPQYSTESLELTLAFIKNLDMNPLKDKIEINLNLFVEILYLAHYFDLEVMCAKMETLLAEHVDEENYKELADIAKELNLKELQKKCARGKPVNLNPDTKQIQHSYMRGFYHFLADYGSSLE